MMRQHLLKIAVILAGTAGCDNVAFGGVDVAVLPAPPPVESEVVGDSTPAPATETRVAGPLLLAGARDSTRATLTLVGEVDGAALRPFPDPTREEDRARLDTLTALGSEWVLFSEGARIGRLVVDEVGVADGFCGERVSVSGTVEVVPPAADATRLLALPAEDAATREYTEYRTLTDTYAQRVANLELAQAMIPAYGATWPTRGVLDMRKQLQAFQIDGLAPYIAATFLNSDELEATPPGQGAYALFVISEEFGSEEGVYTSFRAVDTEGKGAPRYFDHLDWDGDGTDEILLEVFGSNRRWFAGLGRQDGAWVRTFQDACGSGSTSER